ncbi:uncharacterized protein LOC113334132 isoform X1 [Papaver somniferum]|uniref:uncharacterized protein LOC113334132 isoform X1 n=1 Tax=Papaver somniferum TaxID=3469 RepID=UPI000E70091E|nr:uncharacterized protein LOC113334132 isoform X1 [Papaver somniferum]
MAYYNKKLIHEHIKFDSDSLFCDSVLLVLAKPSKMLLLDTVCFKWILFVSSYLCFNFTCSVFDRGRATELIESVYELDLGVGYQSKFQFIYSIVCILAHNGDSSVGGKLLQKMPYPDSVIESIVTLQLTAVERFRKIHNLFNQVPNKMPAAIQEEEIKKNLRSTTDALHSLYFVQHKTFHCQHWLCVGYGTM